MPHIFYCMDQMCLALETLVASFGTHTGCRRRRLSTAKVPKRAPGEGGRRLKEKWIRVGDLKVKIEDGGVSVERQKMGKKRSKSTTVKFLLNSVQEVDANGISVGTKADEPHGVYTFCTIVT